MICALYKIGICKYGHTKSETQNKKVCQVQKSVQSGNPPQVWSVQMKRLNNTYPHSAKDQPNSSLERYQQLEDECTGQRLQTFEFIKDGQRSFYIIIFGSNLPRLNALNLVNKTKKKGGNKHYDDRILRSRSRSHSRSRSPFMSWSRTRA